MFKHLAYFKNNTFGCSPAVWDSAKPLRVPFLTCGNLFELVAYLKANTAVN